MLAFDLYLLTVDRRAPVRVQISNWQIEGGIRKGLKKKKEWQQVGQLPNAVTARKACDSLDDLFWAEDPGFTLNCGGRVFKLWVPGLRVCFSTG